MSSLSSTLNGIAASMSSTPSSIGQGGTIVNYPVPVGTLLNNYSGPYIGNLSNRAFNLAKQQAMPSDWVEVDGYTESFKPDDTQAVRFFRGPWTSRQAFYLWALGTSASFPSAGPNQSSFDAVGTSIQALANLQPGTWLTNPPPFNDQGYITRVPPSQHPEYPWMYCVEAELVRGEGAICLNPYVYATDNFGNLIVPNTPVAMIAYYDASRNNDWISALVKLTYRNVPYTVRTDQEMQGIASSKMELERYVHREFDYALASIGLPAGLVIFLAGPWIGNPIPDNGNYMLAPTQELTYTWIDVPDVPRTAITNCCSHVNQYTFDGAQGWPSYPPGTLLCQAPKTRWKRSPLGRILWDIVYKFLYRSTGWNSLPLQNGTGTGVTFYPIGFKADQSPIYTPADFQQLFISPIPQTVD